MLIFPLILIRNNTIELTPFRYELVGQFIARSVLNGMTLGLSFVEYLCNFVLGGKKHILKDFEAADKELFNSLSSISNEVNYLRI